MAELDPVFGLHADALALQRRRMDVLAANIANADTPNYQARDLDFAAALKAAAGTAGGTSAAGTALAPTATDPRHLGTASGGATALADAAPLVWRVATQPSADGNTVDTQVEQAKFAEAAMQYQAALSFANTRVHNLLTAISGQ